MFDYCDCCACLGIEGSKERLLGDLYHSSPSFFYPFQVFVLFSRSDWIEADGEGPHRDLSFVLSVLDLCGRIYMLCIQMYRNSSCIDDKGHWAHCTEQHVYFSKCIFQFRFRIVFRMYNSFGVIFS